MLPAPRCPVHIGVAMTFVLATAPKRGLRRRGQGLAEVARHDPIRTRPGIFRCAVPGCARCEVLETVEDNYVKCPACQAAPDTHWHAPRMYDHRCKRCYQNANRLASKRFLEKSKRNRRKEEGDAR